jgi:uncharacterized protein YcbX
VNISFQAAPAHEGEVVDEFFRCEVQLLWFGQMCDSLNDYGHGNGVTTRFAEGEKEVDLLFGFIPNSVDLFFSSAIIF